MSQLDKAKAKLLDPNSDTNWEFEEFVWIIRKLGFQLRTGKGSHRHVCSYPGVKVAVPVQSAHGGKKAKPYQVEQIREIVINLHK